MKILVCGPSWVGDIVMAQSLFMTLKERYPDSIIDVLAPAWSLPLVFRMPEVNQAYELPIPHGELGLAKRFKISRRLAANNYDQAIVVPRSIKPTLVPFFAGIPVRTGYKGQGAFVLLNDRRKLDTTRLTMTVQREVALGLPKNAGLPPERIPQPYLRVDDDNRRRLAKTFHLSTDRPVAAFFPGAEFGPAKRWPAEYFRDLGRKLAGAGFDIWIIGGPHDKPFGELIAGNNDSHLHDLTGKTSLEEAIDLISLATIAVTNDSGLMHIAAAVGVQLEVLYGPIPPTYTPPLTEHKTIHYLGLECSPCFQRECPLGHSNCLRQITPEDVLTSIKQRQ